MIFCPNGGKCFTRQLYVGLSQWMNVLDTGNQQPQIYVRESDEIQRKLSLKSNQGGYKIMLIWLPEKMNLECANKLLKLLEEPPGQTVFLLVSEDAASLLPTIISRTQRIHLVPLSEEVLADYLKHRYLLPPNDASDIAHRSGGSLLRTLENIQLSEEQRNSFELFINLMRTAYKRDIRTFSENLERTGGGHGTRTTKNRFWNICQRMIRENFIYNFPPTGYELPESG